MLALVVLENREKFMQKKNLVARPILATSLNIIDYYNLLKVASTGSKISQNNTKSDHILQRFHGNGFQNSINYGKTYFFAKAKLELARLEF